MYLDPYDVPIFDSVRSIPTSTLSMLLFFGTNAMLFLAFKFHERFFAKPLFDAHVTMKAEKIELVKLTKTSLTELSREIFILGCILLYIWICENRPIFDHSEKTHSLDLFWFLSFILFIIGYFTLHEDVKVVSKGGTGDILNRDQTEEWKGWMQVMFLLYHYFALGEVYNAIRVMISCYVWMTGFGNFSFFYIKQDFGFVRFYQMMWRLNFLVFFLCMTMNNLYILYYICPLHTFYFFLTYMTMLVNSRVNHSKYPMRLKMFIAGVIIYFIWEFPAIFDMVFFFLPETPHEKYAVGQFGVKYEWEFRSGLDHYSTFFGMIFALNFPQATLWLKQVEKLPPIQQIIAKGGTAVVLCSLTFLYVNYVYVLPKFEYNALHPYTFIIPLTTYIFLRNLTPTLRTWHMGVLETIGKVTLETYLMQHHIWLTSNAKTLLVLIPGSPILNFAVVTLIYFMVSRKLYRLTINLRARCIPEDPTASAISLAVIVLIFSSFGVLAWIFQAMKLSWGACMLMIFMLAAFVALLLGALIQIDSANADYGSIAAGSFKLTLIMAAVCIMITYSILENRFCMSDINQAYLGPLRPRYEEVPFNEHLRCLRHVNNFSYHKFEYQKLRSESDILIDTSAYFSFDRSTLDLPTTEFNEHSLQSKEDTSKCKIFVHNSKEVSALLKGQFGLFIGDQTVFETLKHILRVSETSGAFPSAAMFFTNVETIQVSITPDSGRISEIEINEASLRDHSKFSLLYLKADDLVESKQLMDTFMYPGQVKPDFVVIGAWKRNLHTADSYLSQIQDLALTYAQGEKVNIIFLSPPHIKSSQFLKSYPEVNDAELIAVDEIGQKLVSSTFQDMWIRSVPFGLVDLWALTEPKNKFFSTIDGYVYSDKLYEITSQIVINDVDIFTRTRAAILRRGVDSNLDEAESLKPAAAVVKPVGGIANNPIYGAYLLAIAGVMIFFFDNYFGLANVFKSLSLDEQRITWEESVEKLHRSIGSLSILPVSTPQTPKNAAIVQDPSAKNGAHPEYAESEALLPESHQQ